MSDKKLEELKSAYMSVLDACPSLISPSASPDSVTGEAHMMGCAIEFLKVKQLERLNDNLELVIGALRHQNVLQF